MRFGWLTLAHSPGPEQDYDAIAQQLEQACLADALGFDGAWLTEPPWQNVDASRNTRAAFNWDQDDCRRASLGRNAHPQWGENPLFPYLVVDEEQAAQCMKARGWRKDGPGAL